VAKYILDTTVLIDHLRGRRKVVELVTRLAQEAHQLGVCCVNIVELYSGLNDEEQGKADRLVNYLDYYDITREIAKLAGSYRFSFARKGLTLTITDTLVAATTIVQDATLVTANVKDYPMEEIKLLTQP
jgi:predicted nucleic acid-binding protein